MNTESPPSGRLVRSLAPKRWDLEEKGKWRIDVYDAGGEEFVATLYQSAEQGAYNNVYTNEFAEGRGATKQEALEALRRATENRLTNVQNALSFDWIADG